MSDLEPGNQAFGKGIPIKNVWLLLWYASDLLASKGLALASSERAPDHLPNFLARILVETVTTRLRQPLSTGYIEERQVLPRVRGRINILPTQRNRLLDLGRIDCSFHSLSLDTPRNRFVRDSLDILAHYVDDKGLASSCQSLSDLFRRKGAVGMAPTSAEIHRTRFGINDRVDRLMVDAATLAMQLRLVTQEAGPHHHLAADLTEPQMRRLFERGIGGFYRHHLSIAGWTVWTGKELNWGEYMPSPAMVDYLPGMTTDIILISPDAGRRLTIDTKFTSIFTTNQFGAKRFKSGHLYQIYTYVVSQRSQLDGTSKGEGLLLYPSISEDDHEVDAHALMQGHLIRLATVDLRASSSEIQKRLLMLVHAVSNDCDNAHLHKSQSSN